MTRNPVEEFRTAALAGSLATFVGLTAGYWLSGMGLLQLDMALLNGNLILPRSTGATAVWVVGAIQTYGVGILLAVVYRRWIRDRLPGNGVSRGLLWGALVATVAGLTVFPLLFSAGVFGLAWAPQAPVSLVVWFLAWGCALGVADQELDG